MSKKNYNRIWDKVKPQKYLKMGYYPSVLGFDF